MLSTKPGFLLTSQADTKTWLSAGSEESIQEQELSLRSFLFQFQLLDLGEVIQFTSSLKKSIELGTLQDYGYSE